MRGSPEGRDLDISHQFLVASRASVLNDMDFTADRGEMGAPAAGAYRWSCPRRRSRRGCPGSASAPSGRPCAPAVHSTWARPTFPPRPVPTHAASGDDDTDCKKVKCIALTFDDGPAVPRPRPC